MMDSINPGAISFIVGVLPAYIRSWLTIAVEVLLCVLLVLLIRLVWRQLH